MINLLSGNSRILLTVDEQGRWGQLYYPHAGQYQHLHEVRLGLFDRGTREFEWSNGTGPVRQSYLGSSNAARTQRQVLGLDLTIDDMVHPNMDLIIRRLAVKNPTNEPRDIGIFHYQSLTILESIYQDTAYWDAQRKTINHYKRNFYFQFWGRPDFDAFTCGEHTLKGLQGSYIDAQDGQLSGGQISHGAADSVVQWNMKIPPGQESVAHLLVMVAQSRHAVNRFHDVLLNREPELLVGETTQFWAHWIENKRFRFAADLSQRVQDVYRRSVFVLRDCSSENGSIVASPDPRTLKSGGDNYNYCWWRDGGHISQAMDEVGLYQNAHRFLQFAQACQEDEGYFLHRHFPDGSVGSTWHPPPFLQVDQTAMVLAAAWHHFSRFRDLDELLAMWPMVRKGADFLMGFVDDRGLPKPSYDLWEERFNVNTHTVACVIHGLNAAVQIGQQLGKRTAFWKTAADRMRVSALQHLWNPARNAFFKSIDPVDETLDSSTLLAVPFGLLDTHDPRLDQLIETIEKRLWNTNTGGVARYEGDQYYGKENPWIICTLWLADAHLAQGRSERCRELIEWTAAHASPTNLLPEQLDSRTGEATSVTPLVWSHSTFLDLVNRYTRATSGGLK